MKLGKLGFWTFISLMVAIASGCIPGMDQTDGGQAAPSMTAASGGPNNHFPIEGGSNINAGEPSPTATPFVSSSPTPLPSSTPTPFPTPIATPVATTSPTPTTTPTPSTTPTPTPNQPSQFTITVQTGALRGPAPFAVRVDASATTGLTDHDFINASFQWNFNEGNVSPAPEDAVKTGFMSSQIYTQPGVYQFKARGFDKAGRYGESQVFTVTVDDPEAIFQNRTFCISRSGDFSGCPSSNPVNHLIQSNLQTIFNLALQPNTRILFNRHETWNTSTGATINQAMGPVQIGVYPNPYVFGGERARININAPSWSMVLNLSQSQNIFLSSLHIAGPWVTPSTPIQYNGGFDTNASQSIHFHDMEIEHTDFHGFYFEQCNDCTISNSHLHDLALYGVYGYNNHNMTIYNNLSERFSNMTGGHGIRFQTITNALVDRNTFFDLDTFTSVTFRGDSQNLLFSRNTIDIVATFAPQNLETAEHIQYFVAERNLIRSTPSGARMGGFNICAQHGVLRDNIYDRVEGAFFVYDHPLVGGGVDISVYNNTLYYPTVATNQGGGFGLIGAGAQNIKIFNNISYNADATPWTRFISSAGPLSELEEHHNLFYIPNVAPNQNVPYYFQNISGGFWTLPQWQALGMGLFTVSADPLFQSMDPAHPAYLQMQATSQAINSGAYGPAFYDYFGRWRTDGQIDRGAIEKF